MQLEMLSNVSRSLQLKGSDTLHVVSSTTSFVFPRTAYELVCMLGRVALIKDAEQIIDRGMLCGFNGCQCSYRSESEF